jgi:hypothetical protein
MELILGANQKLAGEKPSFFPNRAPDIYEFTVLCIFPFLFISTSKALEQSN